jgi:hypothetical protein
MLQDYVNRGRLLENIPEETLAEDWVSLMRAWAAAPEIGQDPRRRDIEAEYSLRGVQPPYALVKAEMDVLARGAAELIQQMDIVAGEEIDSMILVRPSWKSCRQQQNGNNEKQKPDAHLGYPR